MITICLGVMIVWGWVAFISEAIARRAGTTRKVPYPDDVLWALFGGTLLGLGLFGGAPAWKRRAQGSLPRRPLRERRLHSQLSTAEKSPAEGRML
jgi:hypothetical protein